MKTMILTALLAGSALAGCGPAASPANDLAATSANDTVPATTLPANIAAAAADPARGNMAVTDAARHGPEILAFAGVKSGDKVIDLIPGGGYWTKLFAKSVGPSGHVYGIWPQPYAAEARTNVADYQKLGTTPDFANVSASTQPATTLTAAEPVDLVFTAQNYHDYPDKFMGSLDPSVFNKLAFAALKPGGTLLIIDHAAAAGSAMRDTDTLHRIDPATVKAQVVAAGFEFVGESALLANKADNHTLAVFDKAVRGKTDQFIYKFRKPG
ncbi:MAG: class I SAM-dependent methyltransferase [Pseudomonadota bacterium]|uniref:class I SAM-dependent methyltransferase n=1 Tax=Sphingomonas sp. ERG5 TaxID=1381597 RepID=UPI00054BED38|nr:class I SAM-dependent methyltransferase [Sphingomonas sp. ERG5]